MLKKLLLFFTIVFSTLTFSNDKVIKIAAAGYPMNEIVKIAADDLKKQGYDVQIKLLTDYVTANIGLNAKDFDANFHQHEPFMQVFNQKNNGTLVKVKPIYDVKVGFYSKNIKNKKSIPDGARIAIPSDPTNQDRALRILESEGLIKLGKSNGLNSISYIVENKKGLKIVPVGIPSLVQAYQEYDLAFNWPSHILKIGVKVKDALFLEKGSNARFAVMLAAREDNKNSQKIKDLTKAMTSEKVRQFLLKNYKEEGYPVF
ncbi:MetQ/NlpA family ABC transporter substrate-binding protein [Streptobacillus felis]|uniref:Methionine-binding protein n=1 Tax=Streptobacillus felis TaxID=1384509 RepID=A0A7Z0PGN9_9FUSO|nr:MetQ/NlpA family ABC transporter substrate-binding protein [Streptobacillus felis]NYV27715.1 methionine-binding protein [Streptobacillus felis]